MKRNIIRLNESQLYALINKSVKRVLRESDDWWERYQAEKAERKRLNDEKMEKFMDGLDIHDESPVMNEKGEPDREFYDFCFETAHTRDCEENLARVFLEYAKQASPEELLPQTREIEGGLGSMETNGKVCIKGIRFSWEWETAYSHPAKWWVRYLVPSSLLYNPHPCKGILTNGDFASDYIKEAIDILNSKIQIYYNRWNHTHYGIKGKDEDYPYKGN